MKYLVKIIVGIVVRLFVCLGAVAGIVIGVSKILNKYSPDTLDAVFNWLKGKE